MQNTIQITQVLAEDLPAILQLQYVAYQSEAKLLNNFRIPPLTETLEELEKQFASGIILKATDSEDVIIGSVRGQETGETLRVGKLMVHPDRQGRGLGTRLLKEIEKYSSKQRLELFTSDKSVKNIKLYEQAGYSIFKRQEAMPGLYFVYLEKKRMPGGMS